MRHTHCFPGLTARRIRRSRTERHCGRRIEGDSALRIRLRRLRREIRAYANENRRLKEVLEPPRPAAAAGGALLQFPSDDTAVRPSGGSDGEAEGYGSPGGLMASRAGGQDRGGRFPDPLPGIDMESALSALCVSPDIFANILVLFYKNNRNLMGRISRAYDGKDWRTLKQLAHAIKGSAANIRAMALSESAQALENAGRRAAIDPSSPEPPESLLQCLAADLAQVLDAIGSATGIASPPSPPKERPHERGPGLYAPIDRFLAGRLFGEIFHALDLAVPEEIRRHLERNPAPAPSRGHGKNRGRHLSV